MPDVLRAAVSIALFVVLLGSTLGAIVCFIRAERQPRSESARRLMEQEREARDPEPYSPDDDLLSEKGIALRRRGRMLVAVAVLAFGVYWIFALAVVQ